MSSNSVASSTSKSNNRVKSSGISCIRSLMLTLCGIIAQGVAQGTSLWPLETFGDIWRWFSTYKELRLVCHTVHCCIATIAPASLLSSALRHGAISLPLIKQAKPHGREKLCKCVSLLHTCFLMDRTSKGRSARQATFCRTSA